jgi:23S rRNA (guanine2445-N2)-methyltransferase / 23S rRNA (guanine2069-N7)-methyltransferase
MIREKKQFVATCASGLEGLLEKELMDLGADITSTEQGAVAFSGTMRTAYRACLWSRLANRILLTLTTFEAPDPDALYAGARGIAWHDHLESINTFAVSCTAVDSPIGHTGFAALRVKDALVDHFRDRDRKRPSVSTEHPDIQLQIFLKGTEAALRLDLSGASLHMRGYRSHGGDAPLKETLAAAIVQLAGWTAQAPKEAVFFDPLCGSGTLLIEAALIYGDIAPGLLHRYFGFLGWRGHSASLWQQELTEARERSKAGLERRWPRIIGFDADRTAITGALENIERAGLRGHVHVERRELGTFQAPAAQQGFIVTNPPYGERLGTFSSVRYLYRCLGRSLKNQCAGWQAAVFTNTVELADALGMKPKGKHKLFNGPIPCNLYRYDVPEASVEEPGPALDMRQETPDIEAQQFANRLKKNLSRLLPWARQEGISCFRVYDADMPEYNMAIDIYEKNVHVQEYAPPKDIDPAKASQRFLSGLRAVEAVLGIRRSQVFIKVRKQQKDGRQYEKRGEQSRLHEVRESGCRLLVNLTDYLDTGLFLDHRSTRRMLRDMAADKHFLNLFGYTGSASVFAALGRARSTTTVDLSAVYLEWARCNLVLNGISEEFNELVQADCMKWLEGEKRQFDLIFADPPTFSNSKRTSTVFDVQRDHVELITRTMRRLAPKGTLVFSTNLRKFTLDERMLSWYRLEDISAQTIPPDYVRNKRIHQCWKIRHREK